MDINKLGRNVINVREGNQQYKQKYHAENKYS